MKRDTKFAVAAVAVFLLTVTAESALDAAEAKSADAPDTPPAVTVSAPMAEETEAVTEAETWEPFDENEDELIEAALVAQGYYRDDVPLSFELQDNLHTACETYGVPYNLALGLIDVESSFDPDATNGRCYGLCQLNVKYFPRGLTPRENIWRGMEYLGEQLERYDTVEAALEGYHAGHDTGKRDYARAVLANAERWK